MLVEIRIYRRHDADLMMLKAYNVNISKMMRMALDNYVAGERIKFRLPDARPCDITNTSMLRYRLNIKNPEVIRMLKGIKRGYRNQFCKALLRDMLDTFALGVFFDNDIDIDFENKRIASKAMVADGVSLGLITKRSQITTGTIFKERENASEKTIQHAVSKVENEELKLKEERRNSTNSVDKMYAEAEKKMAALSRKKNETSETSPAPPVDIKPQIAEDDIMDDDFGSLFADEETTEEKEEKAKRRSSSLMSMFNDMLDE